MSTRIFQKLLPLLLAIFPLAISAILVARRDVRYVGSSSVFVMVNRDNLALAVQVISAILGSCQVSTIALLCNYVARLHLRNRSFTLQHLAFWSSVSGRNFQLSLPPALLLSLAFILAVLKVPQALWAGALTPLFVDHEQPVGTIQVPTFPLSSAHNWDASFQRAENGGVSTELWCNLTSIPHSTKLGNSTLNRGILTTCPGVDDIEAILQSVSTASMSTHSGIRQRIDAPDWSNSGRSYGVGSSVGWAEPANSYHGYKAYNYSEHGYFANATCIYNASSNYAILPYQNATIENHVATYRVNGTLPNSIEGHVEYYWISQTTGSNNLLAWSALGNAGSNVLGAAGTGYYKVWNQTQCSVTFTPSEYSVYVNITARTIQVILSSSGGSTTDIEPTGLLAMNIFNNLELMSRIAGNNVVSTLGVVMSNNLRIAQGIYAASLTEEEVTLRAMEESLEVMLDNVLIGYGSAELATFSNSQPANVTGLFNAVRVGSDKYTFAVLGVSVLVLVLVLEELARTRFWTGMPEFDFSNVQSIAIAASAGGIAIANECQAMHEEVGTHWTGRSNDPLAGRIRARLDKTGGRLSLVQVAGAVETRGLCGKGHEYELVEGSVVDDGRR